MGLDQTEIEFAWIIKLGKNLIKETFVSPPTKIFSLPGKEDFSFDKCLKSSKNEISFSTKTIFHCVWDRKMESLWLSERSSLLVLVLV